MKKNKKIKDALIVAGWTEKRNVKLPQFYREINCSESVKQIIENIYGLEITYDIFPEYTDHLGYITKFIIYKADINYFESTQKEFKEMTNLDIRVYPIGERSEGLSMYIDDYGNFFGITPVVDKVYFLGSSLMEMFENVLRHECFYYFRDGIFVSVH